VSYFTGKKYPFLVSFHTAFPCHIA
jgi:hypothetical protein